MSTFLSVQAYFLDEIDKQMDPINHVLDGSSDRRMGSGNFKTGKGRLVVNYSDSMP